MRCDKLLTASVVFIYCQSTADDIRYGKYMKLFKIVFIIASVSLLAAIVFTTPSGAGAPQKDCGGVEVAILECDTSNTGDAVQDSALWSILSLVLNIMIGGVGIAAVGGIIYAAIMYASAQDNASQVQQAKDMIRNVIIGLVLMLVMWAGLQYLIPSGIF